MIAKLFYYVLSDIFDRPGVKLEVLTAISNWRDRIYISKNYWKIVLIWILRPVLYRIHAMRSTAASEILEYAMDNEQSVNIKEVQVSLYPKTSWDKEEPIDGREIK